MKTVTVVPIAKSIGKENLTYFSSKDIAVGALVCVPVRSKTIDALVVEVSDVESSKSELKEAAYQLKKIERVKVASIFSDAYLGAIDAARQYYLTETGAVIDAVVPKAILSQAGALAKTPKTSENSKSNLKQEKLIFQAPLEDRLIFYKTFIRESFARKQSVFIALPTIHEIELFAETLSRGIETYTFTLHSDRPVKEILMLYNQILDEPHPILIIATGSYILIPRADINTCVIERENSSAYRQIERPHIDMRFFIELYATEANKKLILADTFLRVETLFRRDLREVGEVAPPIFRLPAGAEVEIVDTKRQSDKAKGELEKKKFQIISDEALAAIRQSISAKKQVFLFTLRKGLGSITLCNDCGEMLLCDMCASPLSLLLKENGERYFRCSRCKRTKDANTLCGNCGSWNLTALGIGTDRVYEELRERFPDIPLFRIDKEITKTDVSARKTMRAFKKTKDAILLGTEMTFFYLEEKVDSSVIISFDSLFSLPSFRIHEKILQLYLALHSYTEKKMIIQTKNPREEIVAAINRQNALNWYRAELKMREQAQYPPFTTLIKISYRNTKREIEKAKAEVMLAFHDYNPLVFQSLAPKIKGVYVVNAVLKIDRSRWGGAFLSGSKNYDKKLERILRSLDHHDTIVDVDPEDLL